MLVPVINIDFAVVGSRNFGLGSISQTVLHPTLNLTKKMKGTHRESVSGRWGFSLGVLITSCTANLNVH